MEHFFLRNKTIPLLASLLLLLFTAPTFAAVTGPGANWQYVRPLSLSPATPAANYQVRVTLTSAFGSPSYTNINANGSDLRFYDNNNNPCNYWIETWNDGGTSTIWVKAPVSGTTTLYMFYGYAAAAVASNGTGTFNFFDDGSTLTGWTNSSATVDNAAGQPLPSFKALGSQYASRNISLTTNNIIEFNCSVISGTTPLCNFYFLNNAAGLGQMFRLDARAGSSSGFATTTNFATWNAPTGFGSVSAAAWHSVRITVKATSADGFIDGSAYGSITFANQGGYVAFHGDGATVTGGNFDNIRVRQYTATEPVTTIGGTEYTNNLLATIPSQTNVLCYGQSTGAATAGGTGGTTPYTFLWSNGQTTATATGFAAGTYHVTVTGNAIPLQASTSVTITQPSAPTASSNSPVCLGNTLNLSASAGTAWAWTGPDGFASADQNPSISNVTGVVAGSYNVTVTNANGCVNAAAPITVSTVPLPTITSSATAATVCSSAGLQNSSLSYSATTNSPTTYTITWDGAALTAGLQNHGPATLTASSVAIPVAGGVANGTYNGTIRVTNANSCNSTDNAFTLTINPSPAITSAASGNVCTGVAQNYTITSSMSSTYTWSRAAVAGISNAAVSGQTANPITETLTNTTSSPVAVTYLITPTGGGCTGSTFTYTVTVSPTISWFSPSWLYRKAITIDYTKVPNSTQIDFPMLVSLVSDAGLSAKALSSGNDILFTTADGTTQIPYQRESYSAGSLVAWVKVPAISHTQNTVIYIYYGNAAASDQQQASSVWDANYAGVYHLNETGTGTAGEYKESKANTNNGTVSDQVLRAVFSMTANANSYCYWELTTPTNYTIVSGDILEYDVYLTSNTDRIAFDFSCTDGANLRDAGATDQNGRNAHPSTDLTTVALNKWHHRVIPIPAGLNGKAISIYDIACENDNTGARTGYLNNIIIRNGSGISKIIYSPGAAVTSAVHIQNPATSTCTFANVQNPSARTISGKINTAFNSDAARNLSMVSRASTAVNNFTLEAWVNPALVSQQGYFLYNGNDPAGYGMGIGDGTSAGLGSKLVGLYGGVAWIPSAFTFTSANTWHHVVMQRTAAGTTSFFVNGTAYAATANGTATPNTPNNFMTVANQLNASSVAFRYFNGPIDEIRISNIARGADWIAAEYNNQNSPSTFYSVSSEQTNPFAAQTATICTGAAFTISPAGAPVGTIYTWTTPVYSPAATITGGSQETSPQTFSQTLTNTTTAVATATYTATPFYAGCPIGYPFTATITVNPLPLATATNSSQTICSAASFTSLALGTSNSITGTTFAWTRDNGDLATGNVTGIAASGSGATIAGATLTNTTGSAVTVTFTITPTGPAPALCVGSAITATVVVNPGPGDNAGADQIICNGSSASIGATAAGGRTYSWSPGTALSNTSAANPTASPTTTTTYTLTETITGTGCSAANTVTVTVNQPIATNTVSSAQTICSGATPVAFTGSTPTGGNGSYTYLWESSTTDASSGFSAASGTNNIQNYTPGALTQNTWYRRTVTSGPCTPHTSSAIMITVNQLPSIASITALPASPICANTTTTLTANGVTGFNPTITWYTGAGGTGNNLGTGTTVVVGAGQTYYAYVTNSCSNAQQSIVIATETIAPDAFSVSDISLTNSPNNSGNVAGVFTLPTVTDNCSGEAKVTVNALPLPANLKLWVKADAGVVTDGSGNVAEWRDLSGNNNHFKQGTFTSRPVRTSSSASFNAQPCITFSTTSKYMTNVNNLDGSTGSTYTIFTISKQNGGTNQRLISSASTNWLMGYWSNAKNQLHCNGWVSASGTPAADAAVHMYTVVSNSNTTNGTILYDYGTALATGTPGAINGPGVLQLNGWNNGLNEVSTGEIAEIIYYNTVLTAAQRQIVEGYLAYKYNLQAPLVSMKAYQNYVNGSSSTVNFMATDQSGNKTTASALVNPSTYPGPAITPSPTTVCSNGSVSVTIGGMAPAGNYLNCATANDYLRIGTSTSASNVAVGSNWTIETWFKNPLPANGGWNTLVRGTANHHIIVSQNATALGSGGGGAVGNLGVFNLGAFSPSGYNFNTNALSNGWHHITAVGTGGATSFYIDGVLVGKSLSQPTDNIVALGNYQLGGQYAGQMDEVRIWNTAVPQNTLSNYMTQQVTATHPYWNNLVAYYRMDGNGNNISTSLAACSSCNGVLQSAASVSSPTAFYTYTATNNIGGTLSPASPSTAETYTITNPSATGTVSFLAAANSVNSSTTSSTTITVNPAPGNNTGGNKGICVGSSGITIGAASTAGNTYSWSPGATLSSTTLSNPFASPTITTTYTLVETTTATGCTASNTATVSVNPVIGNNTVSGVQTICSGKTPTALTGSVPTGGGGGYTYLWESSTTSASAGFSAAAGTNNTQNYSPPALIQNTWFRRTAMAGGCTHTSTAIQVTVNPLPNITITTNYCGVNGAVQLSSNTLSSYIWSTGATTQSITVDLAGIYAVTATGANGCSAINAATVAVELVTNGKFESGNTGFTTAYTNNQTQPNGLNPEGLYAIGTSANNYHGLFFGKDHTTGNGNFMIINGNTTPLPTVVWSQTVPIQRNTDYYFSAFAMTLNQVSPYAQLQFRVNGTQIGTVAVLTQGAASNAGPFVWVRFYGTWNSFEDTTAEISIVDLQTAAGGNDFGLDDISCSTLSPLTFTVSPSGIGPAVCEGDALNLVANVSGGAEPYTYSWSGPNSYISGAENPSISNSTVGMSGTYNLTVTNGFGCNATGSTNIVVGPYPLNKTVTAVASSVCAGVATSIQVAASEAGVSYQLRNDADDSNIGSPVTGNGGTITLPTNNLAGTTTYNILATNTATYCSTEMLTRPTITVDATPVLAITNQAACTGTINLTAPAVTAGSTGAGTLSYWTNAAATTPLATPTAVTSGTYYIKSTLSSCFDIEPVVAIISTTPVATFSYTGTPYCNSAANPLPTFSGGGVAGTFTSTTGLVFASTSTGQINLAASTPGTYTVTNTITPAGACSPVIRTSNITITALPSATFSYVSNALCQSANANDPSPVFTGGSAAGTFSSSFGLTFVSTSTGQIDISACTPGNYAITNTRAAGGGCSAVQHTEYITINPYSFSGSVATIASPPAVCLGNNTTLSLSVPTYRSAVLKENFNGSINNWTRTNTSTGGSPANAAWTLQANGYNYAAATTIFNSNDYSQFYISNSHSQAGTVTATTLQSPAMNTMGYTTLALDFFHYYRFSGTETAKVQVSLNGATWADVATYTTTQGASTGFTNPAINLDAYINQPTLYIRFKYDGTGGAKFFWAIDNISVTGYSNNYTYNWSSTPSGLTSTLPSPVAAPEINTAYQAIATNTYGCSSNATPDTVIVNPLPADNAGTDQYICPATSTTIGAASVAGHTYSWSPATNLSNAAIANPTASPAGTTNYTLTETITATGCTAANNVQVNIYPVPDDKATAPEATVVCSGGSTNIQVANSVAGTDYLLRYHVGNTAIGSPVTGTGGTIDLPTGAINMATDFNVLATTTATGCEAQMLTTAHVDIAIPGMWVGLYSSNWNDAGNWCTGVPTLTTDVVIPQGTPYSPVIQTPAYCHNLTINSGNSLSIITGGDLSLYGNLVVNGAYNHPAGLLQLKGDSTQTIAPITATNVVVDNSSQVYPAVRLTGDMAVRNTLTLTNGIICTGTNSVIVQDTMVNALTGGNDSCYISGLLRRAVGDTGQYAFPVGDTTHYQLATIKLTGNPGGAHNGIDSLTALFTRVSSEGCSTVAGSNVNVNGTVLDNLLNGGYWTIHANATNYSGVTYDVKLQQRGYNNAPADTHRLAVIKRTECAAPWQSMGVHVNTTQSMYNNTVTAVRTALTSFSDFGIGFGGQYALPVQMTYLEAYGINNQYIRLSWATALEINNKGFEILRSTDGINFEKTGWVNGHNNSTTTQTYTSNDMEVIAGVRYYYKLNQVDFDGQSSETEMVTAILNAGDQFSIGDFFPNPAAIHSKLIISTPHSQNISVKVYDALGQIVMTKMYTLAKGHNDIDIDTRNLPDATYSTIITTGDKTYARSLVVIKN